MNLRILFKLALIPLLRSKVLLTLMMLSFAQILLALWLCGGIQHEIHHSEQYASEAHFMSVQIKDELPSTEPIRQLFEGYDVGFEELKTEDVLKRMEQEEPEIVATVRSTGNEGLQLMPRVLIVRGVFPDSITEKIKMMTEVYKVEVSPIHHHRLFTFYQHLSTELRVAILLLLFLSMVQLLVFERIQHKDAIDGLKNLVAWGVSSLEARVPGFLSLLLVTVASFFVSIAEWTVFQRTIWKDSPFLGELSLDHQIGLPFVLCVATFVGVIGMGLLLSFSGRSGEE